MPYQGLPGKIVIDLQKNACQSLIAELRAIPDYADLFISGQDALVEADNRSLLIVVDTNRPGQVESRPLLEAISRVVLIDHHRNAADSISQTVVKLHEPSASSASELVTELLQYAVNQRDLKPIEAQALLSGIVLDTKISPSGQARARSNRRHICVRPARTRSRSKAVSDRSGRYASALSRYPGGAAVPE